ncbi:hypothetical protein AMS58_08275 [Pseudoalteromonas porphyrae]|uniref:Response regulatory domain-containing protein n=2 Tax=Pseudoalteromonas TaxID=53246 RepID=A0A0N1EVQ1_9GAMM|nr:MULTISPECIES: response regulator [Pseudoalteromonas]KPH64105.1 hypothetical protein ADS77_06750 [Pseudoalteromonas porphyrae]KPH94916.1 hypothetical protein AMS58_08275 [Pseudoalteromonas porphyrae]NMR24165.1 response regulator [Pseudoalteromonas sp. NEC-BIFX-2020_015]NNG43018.1 response regulator [Pseudoalteromonas sp. NEC-BIFX-2020_002]
MSHTIVIVDDDEAILRALNRLLKADFILILFTNPLEAIKYAKENEIDLVISDLLMPNIDGLNLLEQFKQIQPDCSRMLLTGYADLETSKSAIKQNIAHLITSKPWDNFELVMLIRLLIENSCLRKKML